MKSQTHQQAAVLMLILAWLLAACSPVVAQKAEPTNVEMPVASLPIRAPTTPPEKVVSLGTPLPTKTAEATIPVKMEQEIPSAKGGFVVFNREEAEFIAYQADGSLAYRIPAAGIQYASPFAIEVVDGAVYYLPDDLKKFVRAMPAGVKVLDIPADFMSKIAVSADEKYIAWSMFDPSGSSTLWVAQMDEGQNVLNPREIARYSAEQSEAFSLSPIEWTEDGRLLFERGLTGIGGYILYGGYNSLYSYDAATEELATIVPAEENHGLCLENYRPDLEKVLFHCSKEKQEIVIRDLNGVNADLRVPQLPDQGVAGSASLSPTGLQLAYAIARSNPDNESGEVVVVPANLSSVPVPVAGVADNSYPAVLGWLDENTILFSQIRWPDASLWSVHSDGSELKEVTTGMFLGWIR